MKTYHHLLERQLRRSLGESGTPPDAWRGLLDLVDEAYRQADQDRLLLERSVEISSQELLQANADIRAVLDGLIDYYTRLDERGKVLYERGRKLPAIFTGEDPLTGRMLRDTLIAEAGATWDRLLLEMRSQDRMAKGEVACGPEDARRHYELRLIPAHGHQISVVIRDITESHILRERERALQMRLARAERIESVGVLAGGIAHDLNNILAPLVSYPDLILDDLPAGNPSRGILKQMQKAAMRAAAIIQDLMTMARRGNHATEPVQANEAIRTYLDSADFRALSQRYPGVQVVIDLDPQAPSFIGATHQFTQALMNLVGNAFEAIKTSTGTITVRTRAATMPGGHGGDVRPAVRVEVSDTGCGIPADEREHIFEPFFSRRKSGSSGTSGTGLGLAIVYSVIKDFGGTIDVISEPETGTTFTILLPGTLRRADTPLMPTTGGAGFTSVLVVDDEPVQRELCRVLLGSKGCRVSLAASGREAVAFLREHDVDIVLLDMIMEADFDGLDTYEAIRAFKPDQRCVIVSGYSESDRALQALANGVRGFVQKPYTLTSLCETMRKAMA
ncbi:MAG TPA: ATP-binding protein [Kiritimatiellia bacterium]|nr:ATP-binding protein [Kiritimatiellia bacterium]HMO99716.1 ATP-binding protein [Kiritimatiellia bacterium]